MRSGVSTRDRENGASTGRRKFLGRCQIGRCNSGILLANCKLTQHRGGGNNQQDGKQLFHSHGSVLEFQAMALNQCGASHPSLNKNAWSQISNQAFC